MNRIDTLSATLTVVAVLSIGFFIYQATETPGPTKNGAGVKNVHGTKVQETSTKTILADWTREPTPASTIKSPIIPKEPVVTPVLVSNGTEASKTANPDPPRTGESTETPPALTDVHFRFDRSGLSQETRTLLDRHLTVLKDPRWSVLVQGHTDREGTIQQNLRVGLYRAKAVKKYLMDHGVLPEQIQVVSLGEFQPTCADNTPECQHQNRRVSFSLAHRDLPKEQVPTVTASTQTTADPVQKDWHTSGETTETISPAPIVEVAPSEALGATVGGEQAVASLQPSQREGHGVNPEPKSIQMPVEPIIPEPVHSTPPPAMDPAGQGQQHN